MSAPVLQVFVFRDGEYVGSEMFSEAEVVIGSGQQVDLHLNDESVANNHAILSHENGTATLLDLGSGGGTLINRTTIQHSYVTPRDEIQIGQHTLKLKFITPKSSRPRLASPAPVSEPPRNLSARPPVSQAPVSQIPVAPSRGGSLGAAGISNEPLPAHAEAPTQVTDTRGQSAPQNIHVQTETAPRAHQPSSAIDDLITNELASSMGEITASIAISGSDVVQAKSVSAPSAPSARKAQETLQTRSRPEQRIVPVAPSQKSEAPTAHVPTASSSSDTGPIQLPEPARAAGLDAAAGLNVASAAPVAYHDFDDEELDEDDIDENTPPPFSLVDRLTKEMIPREGNALEIVVFSKDGVRQQALLEEKGDKYVLGRKNAAGLAPEAGHTGLRLASLVAPGRAAIQFPSRAEGAIEQGGQSHALDAVKVPRNAVSKKGDAFGVELRKGQRLTVHMGGYGFHVRFVDPPHLREAKRSFRLDPYMAKVLALSLVFHLVCAIAVALTSEGVSYSDLPKEEWAELKPDDTRDVEIEEPEPVPEPEPEPEPIDDEPDRVDDEPEPEPEKRPPPKKRVKRGVAKGMPKKQVKNAGVLGAMGKLNLKAPGRKSMVQAVSNIDAVKAPGGSNFRVGALVGKLPSSKISSGGGGGGKLLTRGSAALLKGGKGFARIGKKKGTRVRGSVRKVRKTRLKAKGSISREEVARVINKHLSEVQYCYEKALLKNPGLSGKLVLEWTIKTNGSVGRVKQKLATLRSPKVSSCIMRKLKRWRFPKPRGGVVIVSYPFIFSSVGF